MLAAVPTAAACDSRGDCACARLVCISKDDVSTELVPTRAFINQRIYIYFYTQRKLGYIAEIYM